MREEKYEDRLWRAYFLGEAEKSTVENGATDNRIVVVFKVQLLLICRKQEPYRGTTQHYDSF